MMIFSESAQQYTNTLGTITDLFFRLFPKRHKSAATILSYFDRVFYKRERKFLRLRHKAIAKATGLSLRTVVTWINFLVDEGWLFRQKSELAFSDFYLINTEKITKEVEGSIEPEDSLVVQTCTPSCKFAQQLYSPTNINKIKNQEVFEDQNFIKEEVQKPVLKKDNLKSNDLNDDLSKNNGGNTETSPEANIPPAPEKQGINAEDEIPTADHHVYKKHLTEAELVIREEQRNDLLEQAEGCGVDFQVNGSLKELCLKADLKIVMDAIKALEQQTINKRQLRQSFGENGLGINNSDCKLFNPSNWLRKAVVEKWKPNTKKESQFTQNGSGRLFQATMPLGTIYNSYKNFRDLDWKEVAERFGHSDEAIKVFEQKLR